MIEKEFIPYEQALALKELGFDEPCLAYWYNETPTNPEGQCLVYYKKPWDEQKIINGIIRDYYVAPTYSQSFRWFREKYKIRFIIQSSMSDLGEYFKVIFPNGEQRNVSYNTYEEAELACIKQLIEIVKNQ